MITPNKKLQDSEIMRKILDALNLSPTKLAAKLDYNSHNSIYNVLNGKYPITDEMIKRILAKIPMINYSFLINGTGEVFIEKSYVQAQCIEIFFNLT